MHQTFRIYRKKLNDSCAHQPQEVFSNVAAVDQRILSLCLNLEGNHTGGKDWVGKAKEWGEQGPSSTFALRNCLAWRRIISSLGGTSFQWWAFGCIEGCEEVMWQGRLPCRTWRKLIWHKWGNIIFPIITSKGYLKSKSNYLNIELFCLLGRERIWKWWWYSLFLNYSFYESDLNSLLQMGPFGQNDFISIICCWVKNVLCLSSRLDMTSLWKSCVWIGAHGRKGAQVAQCGQHVCAKPLQLHGWWPDVLSSLASLSSQSASAPLWDHIMDIWGGR